MNNEIFEPLKLYKSELREKHQQLTEDYFDKLVKQSGVDVDANAHLMSQRKDALARLDEAQKHVKKHKSIRGFVIFCIVMMFVVALVADLLLISYTNDMLVLEIILPIVLIGGGIGLIVVISKVLNKRISKGNSVVNELQKDIAQMENEAWAQMRPLNLKYDWNIPDELIYKTTPNIQLDKYFDEDKHEYFKDDFGLSVAGKKDVSVYCARSGNSRGNPFLLIRYFIQNMVQHTYTGTRTVTWTEHYYDSEGKRHTRTVSQTLVATVSKPKPNYYFNTCLYYGNDAAPSLKFSRSPVVPKDATDKKIDSLVKSGEKQLEKKARKAVNDGTTYNKLANSEFEVLFGASNRDNETQFRLMFTPLAQQNMVALLKNKEPYGDDFTFEKHGKVNLVYSSHGANLDIEANPEQFVDFDLARARKNFIEFNVNYFASLYFDFAPLFSVPIYQQERPSRVFGKCDKRDNIGDIEIESIVNDFNPKLFAAKDAMTDNILKAVPISADGNGTYAKVTAHSFRGEERVDIVPVMARNGSVYNVPVPWIEYFPVEKTTDVYMQAVDMNREEFLGTEDATSGSAILVGGVKATLVK